MNREEAHKNIELLKLKDNFLDACDIGSLHLLINEIFDDFEKYENKSCESCKYCDKGQNIQWCDNPEVNKYRNMAPRVDLDFYCKYWSAKDKDK
jgi:hypothetical protein